VHKYVRNFRTQCGPRIFIFLLTAILIGSCNLDPVIIDKDSAEIPIVVSLLCPERQGVEVYVARSFPEMRNEPVINALVKINHGSESISLLHVQNGFYRNSAYQIQQGESYNLFVKLENGKILTGATFVPPQLIFMNVQPGDTLWFEKEASSYKYFITAIGPEISWGGGQNAAVYVCYFAFADTVENQNQTAVATTQFSVKTRLSFYHYNPNGDGEVVVKKPIRNAKLVLCAIDSNFYQNGGEVYSAFFGNVTAPDFSHIGLPNRSNRQWGWSNITNGSGVFGAYTYATQEVIVALKEPY
jgi:hypothetical protein